MQSEEQPEKQGKKTRRGGKSRKRKLDRDERWRLQQQADEDSDSQLPQPTEQELKKRWADKELLELWGKGYWIARPPDDPPRVEPTLKELFDAADPKPIKTPDQLPPAPKFRPQQKSRPQPPSSSNPEASSSSSSSSALTFGPYDLSGFTEEQKQDFVELRKTLNEKLKDPEDVRTELLETLESIRKQHLAEPVHLTLDEEPVDHNTAERSPPAEPASSSRDTPAPTGEQLHCASFDLHRVLDCWDRTGTNRTRTAPSTTSTCVPS